MLNIRELTDSPAGRHFLFDLALNESSELQKLDGFDVRDPAVRAHEIETSLTHLMGRDLTASLHPQQVQRALARVVASANYWQSPSVNSVALETAEVRIALVGVFGKYISAIVDALMMSALESVGLSYFYRPAIPSPSPSEVFAAIEQQNREADSSASFTWWSTPRATSGMQVSVSINKAFAEQFRFIWGAEIDGDAGAIEGTDMCRSPEREYVVESLLSWRSLVERFPMDVSRSRAGAWSQYLGKPVSAYIPDFSAMSEYFDSVYVHPAGYLAAAGQAVAVRGGVSVMAGWTPGARYWLTAED